MKRLTGFIALLILVPTMAFSQVAIGGIALMKSPVLLGDTVNIDNMNVDQFCFGADVRFKANWLLLETVIVGSTGPLNSLDIYLDAGVTFDLAIFRLSAGIGPNFVWNIGHEPPVQAGMNAKIGADVMLNKVSVGLTYIMAMSYNDYVASFNRSGLLGLQVLFWL